MSTMWTGLARSLAVTYTRLMTQTIGNASDAYSALSGNMQLLSAFGCARMVYRKGDTVYKVERGDSKGANYREHRRGLAYRNFVGTRISIPFMTLYSFREGTVLAMPYIDGVFPNTLPADIHNDIFSVSEDATVWGNVIQSGETYYLIDLDC